MLEKSRLKAEAILCGEGRMICSTGAQSMACQTVLPLWSFQFRPAQVEDWAKLVGYSDCTCIFRSLSCQSWKLSLLRLRWSNSIRNRLKICLDRLRFRSCAQLKPKIHPSALFFSVLCSIVFYINLSRRYTFTLLLTRLSSFNLAFITLIIIGVFLTLIMTNVCDVLLWHDQPLPVEISVASSLVTAMQAL